MNKQSFALELKQLTEDANMRLQQQQNKEAENKKKEESKMEARAISYFENIELKEIRESLLKNAQQGLNFFVFKYENYDKITELIKEFAKQNKLTYIDSSYWVDADNGDPDSGEGRCFAHGVNQATLTW